jgi:predicted nucleic acid-binding protein
MAWAIPDERSEYAERVLRFLGTSAAAVPQVWRFEVANTLLVSERRARMTEDDTADFLEGLRLLPISIETMESALERLVVLGRAHRTSGYDAAYLDLAFRRELPLATTDELMRNAAEHMGIGFFDPS